MKRYRPAATAACIVFALAFAVAPAAPARSARRAQAAIVATKGAFFAVSVADLDASAQWYAEKLGLEVVLDVPETNGAAVRVLEGGGLVVELVRRDDAAPCDGAGGDPSLAHGVFKVGVLVKDLDKTLARLAARGVPVAFGPFPAQGNQRANAIIRDNAGNLIQLFQR
jgi:catechol 2,3-dioxygenase-like lactoylglutathione lyase family enzyme